MTKIAVIGGGASGLACAIEILHTVKNREDVKVTVFEKLSRIGKKILVTGNGRCNLTNINAISNGYRGDVEFSEFALNKYSPESNITFLTN
jgi:predicted flavoprotein YhiN